MYTELNQIKEQLFDAPVEVKQAFNEVVKYFDGGWDWKVFATLPEDKVLLITSYANKEETPEDDARIKKDLATLEGMSTYLNIESVGTEKRHEKMVKYYQRDKGYKVISLTKEQMNKSSKDLAKELIKMGIGTDKK